ncbi:SAM-dependent methyltransferase [Paenibacillus pasadenensis]|uniref:Methyltransferase domain-containing protein n=1 Tax=Paenibacillus pasadenensis TaxID=217090 RepID=A0A2N5NBB5_9BACL|nr:SAM-dependent methyltransferase [Paenibacillus pasadenensis]PLT47604.1 hypothetical protein B8V81_1828 [Paenibacillus pasadenensis]
MGAHAADLQEQIDRYSELILEPGSEPLWEALEQRSPVEAERLADELRSRSALAVAQMEKHRALRLLEGAESPAAYFRNIESCIEEEFGHFAVTPESKVLMVGSGSFPMTPLLIARRTGAEVLGVDIDAEAVELGRQVARKLGPELPIRIEHGHAHEQRGLEEVTHLIFSSTIPVKYELLERLHPLTSPRATAAMRYGDGFKSLFNYPMRQALDSRWLLAGRTLRPDRIFDIALYVKDSGMPGGER